MKFETKKEALKYVAGLSNPSKMPCKGYSIPAEECGIGSQLRLIKNSVCSDCYACKGCYPWKIVQDALYRRLETIFKPHWVDAMSYLIKDMPYFRWHDSGDLQNVLHLDNICSVAKNCPKTKFWLPTRENRIVNTYLKDNKCPINLCIRVSGAMIDGSAPYQFAKKLGVTVSEVRTKNWDCPASKQNNECRDCRRCWSNKVFNVVYHKH